MRHRFQTTVVPLSLRLAVCSVVLFIVGCERKPPPQPTTSSPPTAPHPTPANQQLAKARLELARHATLQHQPDQALPLLCGALTDAASSSEALQEIYQTLTTTTWLFPETSIDHRLPIDHLAFHAPNSLWVAVDGHAQMLFRWNLPSLKIESLLFPTHDTSTNGIVLSPNQQTLVIERAGILLLVNAQSLKPIIRLGILPTQSALESLVTYSPDGLLLAHPSCNEQHQWSWHIRDANTGEILRSTTHADDSPIPPLAAAFVDQQLLVIHPNGNVLHLPIFPTEPATHTSIPHDADWLFASFSANPSSLWVLQKKNASPQPQLTHIPLELSPSTAEPTAPFLAKHPWSRHTNLWTGLLSFETTPEFFANQERLSFPKLHFASIPANDTVTAIAMNGSSLAVGQQNGMLTVYRLLPRLSPPVSPPPLNDTLTDTEKSALTSLCQAVSGYGMDPNTGNLFSLSSPERILNLQKCEIANLPPAFQALPLQSLQAALSQVTPRSAPPESMLPMWNRLAQADSTGDSWPDLLNRSAALSYTPWHKDLSAAVTARSQPKNPPAASSWIPGNHFASLFQSGPPEKILETIQQQGQNGPLAAKLLQGALESDHPSYIAACLETAENLPPFLRQLAYSRQAWLEKRVADAISVWPDPLPDLSEVRKREDWSGWEQADFSKIFYQLRQQINDHLSLLEVPTEADSESLKEIAARFNDPQWLQSIGQVRFASACLKAALVFSTYPEEKETTFRLANQARTLGAPAEDCLRAEAYALTALKDFDAAHQRWLNLITDYPVKNHQPKDYTEAAYTAFELSNPQQAIALLITGMNRFPQDSDYAVRAAWIALLTDNPENAYRFLVAGRSVGYNKDQVEKATALMCVAAAQINAIEDAMICYQELIALDPDWKKIDTIIHLEWPEEFSASLLMIRKRHLEP